MLHPLRLLTLLWAVAASQFIFYATNHLQFDCLYYPLGALFLPELIQYCHETINNNNLEVFDSLGPYEQNFTFDELYHLNITAYDLLSWSTSIDLAEQYQYYIDEPSQLSTSSKIFFNCTQPWFGARCQYSLELSDPIILADASLRNLSIINHTCYILLDCVRVHPSMCLDWREVCDGRIDCLNGDIDEMECFDLEINECDPNEYRCHNGLCISKIFWKNEEDTAEYLDQSDLWYIFECPISLFTFNTFHMFACEEYSCRPGEQQFSCGNGQCVEDFDECQNGRHLSLVKSMNIQGNLSYDCWVIMTCLSKIIDEIDGQVCEHIFNSSRILGQIQTCEYLTQFPTIPVLFGHVRFLYVSKNISYVNISSALVPNYVCYDEQLCDFLIPTFHHEIYTCRHGHEMGVELNVTYDSWKSIIDSVKPFFRGCRNVYHIGNSSENSLYICKNSSKSISPHRIIDNISDCYLNDDETAFELSCSMKDTQRFMCPNEIQCRSPLFRELECPSLMYRSFDEILFHEICDGIVDTLPVKIDEQNHTDDTDCQNWQCNNIYTRCNGIRSCPNGDDEENCVESICPSRFIPCVSPYNFTLTCLSVHQITDGFIDCLRASNELQYCRKVNFYNGIYEFHCLNSTKCVKSSELCDSIEDCPLGDDEEFCNNRLQLCDRWTMQNLSDVQEVLCHIVKTERIPFSLKNLQLYPRVNITMISSQPTWSIKQYNHNENWNKTISKYFTWSTRCNRGIPVYLWSKSKNNSYRCFCPQNYYGDRCQYQNQRVSFTLTLATVDMDGIYAIVIILIDDADDRQEINSYNQAIYVPAINCRKPISSYLLYSTRPKNNSKNYSIRVDAFDKDSLTYLASWHLNILFLFLPVNRLATMLTLPSYQPSSLNNCTFSCYNGVCMEYINKEQFFCKCYSGWSGIQCHLRAYCSDCSSDSICVGSIANRSICVCPSGKFGSRCLLKYSCPINYCKNNGRYVVLDQRMIETSFFCLCSEQFYGPKCELPEGQLTISFHNMTIPPYLFVIIYSAAVSEPPRSSSVKLQKLTMFQRQITLYNENWFQIVFVKIDTNYYLAVLQEFEVLNISTSIGPDRQCLSINELLDSSQFAMPKIQRVKFYHIPCQTHHDLQCFFDEAYMCFCTQEHHANCFKFSYANNFLCQYNIHCYNGGTCLQDSSICNSNTICICMDCFFGDRCQFYAKGIGLTLDDMLRYAILPNINFNDQSYLIKVSAILTMIMFIVGLLNSILCFITFYSQESRQVGCGIYIYASSITSALTIAMLTIKFWFVVISQINLSINRSILHIGYILLEPVLKLFLYMNNWLNACVAIERAVTVFKGINFDRTMSKSVARWMILLIPSLIIGTIIYESSRRDLFDNHEEQRVWCVTRHSESVKNFNIAILLFHFFTPFSANLLSAVFIIFAVAHQQAGIRTQHNYTRHLREQFYQHKHLIISQIVVVILSLPRFITSLFTGCVKESHNSWLYIFGYLISFVPSAIVFIVFVLPSELYRRQFKRSIKSLQQRSSRL
ncbi:unnamed protein product [Rotaria sp. Silwood2]|nr:unnamed protein product [Rotaria sp. Silwood2]